MRKSTGLTDEQIRNFSPEKLKIYLEMRNKKKLNIISEFSVIGRKSISEGAEQRKSIRQ